jgi:hypothetical protein
VEQAASGTPLKENAAAIQGLDVVAITWWMSHPFLKAKSNA